MCSNRTEAMRLGDMEESQNQHEKRRQQVASDPRHHKRRQLFGARMEHVKKRIVD